LECDYPRAAPFFEPILIHIACLAPIGDKLNLVIARHVLDESPRFLVKLDSLYAQLGGPHHPRHKRSNDDRRYENDAILMPSGRR